MQNKLLIVVLSALCGFAGSTCAQSFTIGSNQVEIVVAPAFNHVPVGVAVAATPSGSISNLVVSSDAAWVTPAVDAARSQIVLSFATSNLISQSYTATIRASLAGQTNNLFVRAYVSPLSIFKLKDDPLRSRTYGIHQNGLNLGSVVALDPVTSNHVGNVTVGRKPSDLAISTDGREMFVINCVDETISVIDLVTLSVKETLALPAFDNWGQNDTTANVGVGPGSIIYYTDGAWAPVLRVLNRSTMQVLQTVLSDGEMGFGDFALTSDKTLLFGWSQYGWSAGFANSFAVRFTVSPSGLLTFSDKGQSYYDARFARDPLETPVLITSDNQTVFIKGLALGSNSVANIKYSFPGPVYSITPGGEVAVTATSLYETETGIKLADLPQTASVQTISSDYSRLIYFDSAARAIKILNLLNLIGPGYFNRDVVPPDGSITLAPSRLEWGPLPGVDRYHVYFGASESAVASAGTNSPLFLGAVTQPFITLTAALTPGTKYFWRVDAVTAFDVAAGDVKEFTVSIISSSVNEINVATVRGHRDFITSFYVNSGSPGVPWQASADQSWVSFTQTTGSTPALVQVVLDASQLSVGLHQANVTISSGASALFSLPVKFRVEPLNLTIVKSDPTRPFVYAISEDTSTTPVRAYLLEINTVTEAISRVVPVGASVTDLALHKADNRIYVPNWLTGALLAIDLTTFEQVRAYAFAPFGGTGYSEGDIYRVSAGVAGRIVWEEEDQWIDINIFDTVNGTNIASAFVREGGGGFDPTGRYYYHGENNSSGAVIEKFDVTGDRFTSLTSIRVAYASYYGSRVVTISETGNRIFWNGAVFDPNLTVEWAIGEHIYACSADGRYAFGESKVFDVDQRNVLMTTQATTAKAFNSITGKLVYKGSNGIAYLKLDSQEDVIPADGAIVTSVNRLEWEAFPFDAVYHVYLGQSPGNLPFLNGTFGAPYLMLPTPLSAGTYFWRVDAITEYGTVTGRVHSFTISPIRPTIQQITAATFQNRHVTASITLTSPAPGEVWQALPNASWITLSQSNGVTPATIQVTLNASVAPPIVRNGSIAINGTGGTLFSIPVQLTVEGLYLTILKSDPASHRVYGISEDTSANPRRAYLLEINTQTETIEHVVSVGSSVTDLAVHNPENRLYVPNWQTGALLAIDKTSFQPVRSYSFAPFGGGEGDVYRVSAGVAGRIVWEEQDQWIDINIFDTVNGTNIASAFVREGGGGFDPTGRYYYHGENNSSGAVIHKFDVTGDRFTSVTSIRVDYANYYGSRVVTISETGNRVFWNGAVFNANLVEEWAVGEHIYSCSADGRYAFAAARVYDVNQRQAILSMPVTTQVSAFNSSTRKLVVQSGNALAFFPLTEPLSLPAPVLSVGVVSHNSVQLSWTDRSLEDNFTLQRRIAGSATWQDIATIPLNATQYTATGLQPATPYEFRIKANAGSISSDWSAVVTATTTGIPPTTPSLFNPVATTTAVSLTWSDPLYETEIILERSVGTQSNWSILARLPADTTSYVDTNAASRITYYYRVKATNNAGESAYSTVRTVTVPAPAPPPAPANLVARSLSNATILVTWNDVADETGYRLERRYEDPTSWTVVTSLASNVISYVDTNVVEGVQYWYRVQAFNRNGDSQYSNQDDAVPARIVVLLADDFDPDLDPAVWANISGGVATNGGQGFRGSKALYFGAAAARSAATVPVDVSSGGTIEFRIRGGNEAVDGNALWNNSEGAESVVLEYSKDGANWSPFNLNLSTVYPSASDWIFFSIPIPSIAFSPTTQFRWRQLAHSGPAFDCWALEDVAIHGAAPLPPEAPPFVLSSASSSTSISVLWIGANRAAHYVVERRRGSEAWAPVATVPATITYFIDTSVVPGMAFSYRIKAVNAGGVSPYSPVTTSLTWSQLQQWAYDNFGSPDAMNGVLTKPDDDGTLPLFRYAFNLNGDEPARYWQPGATGGFPAIWLDTQRNRLCIEFVRRKASMNPGIAYRVQFGGDLGSWQDATPVSTSSIDALWERVRYEDGVPATQATARFGRVLVIVE